MMKRTNYFFSPLVLAVVAMLLGCSTGTSEPSEPHTMSTSFHDAFTTASVKLALAFKPGVRAIDIKVETDGGKVTLTGEVRSEAERELAAKVAEDVSGVKEVVNDIEVHG